LGKGKRNEDQSQEIGNNDYQAKKQRLIHQYSKIPNCGIIQIPWYCYGPKTYISTTSKGSEIKSCLSYKQNKVNPQQML